MSNVLVKSITLVLLFVLLTGCDSSPDPADMMAKATDSNLKRVSKMYSIFMKNNGWRGPKNLEQLKTFIDKQNEDQLLMMGIDPSNLDSIFIGEHDDQPLKIRWNLKSSMLGSAIPIVFEATPSEGEDYQVGFTGNTVRTVDSQEYQQLWEGKMDRASKSNLNRR